MVQDVYLSKVGLPVGVIMAWTATSPPTGWLLCNGTPQSRTSCQTLFAVIGEAFGKGDGTTTFDLPNMQARIPAGFKQGDALCGSLGAKGTAATNTVTLTAANLPQHTHTCTVTPAGSHSHASSTDSGGSHTHSCGPSAKTGWHDQTWNSNSGTLWWGGNSARGTNSGGITHNHSFTTGGSGNHTHTCTTDGGSGPATAAALDITNPFITVQFIIKKDA
jgi:microcystin-dependent protein